MDVYRILFVCLGNICRSPLAEGIFLDLIRRRGQHHFFEVDSAGTGDWHVGERPDPRSLEVARKHAIELPSRARQIQPEDFQHYDLIVAMDHSNLHALSAMAPPEHRARLILMRDYDPQREDGAVPDPYFGGTDGFDLVYNMLVRSLESLLDHIDPTQKELQPFHTAP
mgnify:CR=1 FL=1